MDWRLRNFAPLFGFGVLAFLVGCSDSGSGGSGAAGSGGIPANTAGAAGTPTNGGAGSGATAGSGPSGGGGASGGASAGRGGSETNSGGTMTSSGGSGAGGSPAGAGGQPTAGSGGASAGSAGTGNGGTSGGASAGSGGTGMAGAPGNTKTFVYVGTGDWGKAGGGRVRAYSLDESALTLASIESATAGALPSYVTVAPNGQSLYAGDEDQGSIFAFSVDRATGKLTALNSLKGAGNPVYLKVDKSGKFLLSAYYNQGAVEVFSLGSDLRIGASAGMRQTGSQSHSIVPSPDNAFVFVPVKGANNIAQLELDATSGALTPNTPPTVSASGGPRHLEFHPSAPLAYVVNEIGNTIRSYTYDATAGTLTQVDEKSTLPPEFSGNSTGADVHVEPTGKFVYTSNRAGAQSTIAIFSTDAAGKLTLVGHELTRGSTPRAFGIHPSGRALLVANQDSSNVATFRLDPATGRLTFVQSTDVGDKAWTLAFLVAPE